MDVSEWLSSLGLEQYRERFNDNDIDPAILETLTADDLCEIGVGSVGHRRRLLNAIADLSVATEKTASSTHNTAADASQSDTKSTIERDQTDTRNEAERRHLTVMFVDMVGSTELSTRIDPEDVRDVLTRFQDTVAGAVSRFDGFVARFMGDGALCYFGWPTANEDDAERAVHAGLSIIDRVKNTCSPDGKPLATRIGIASGLVIVGDLIGSGASEQAAVVGETPNLAARLQSVAAPNQLFLAEATRRLLNNIFTLEPGGTHELKGIAAPVETFWVSGVARSESRFEAHHMGNVTPLVGRGQELQLIREGWTNAISGSGQIVLLTGEAGIGKSRIVQAAIEEFKESTHKRITFQCSPYHTESAFYPIIHQMQYAARLVATDSVTEKLQKLQALSGIVVENMPLLAAMLGIDVSDHFAPLELTPAQVRTRTMQALVNTLVRQADESPVLVVFEDLHWIDPTTLEFLNLAVDAIGDQRIFVLATSRPAFIHGFGGHPDVTRFALNRLGRDQVLSIVGKLTQGKAVPEEVLQIILQRTDGVPLFVEELTKTILESGVLQEATDRFVLNGPLNAPAIPNTLHDSLMARLDRLQPIKEVAQIASCIGREFPHQLLAHISSLPEEPLNSALAGLVAAELIYRRGVLPEAQYEFKHALVRDAAYESLLKRRRRGLHEAILKALELQPNVAPEVLATHAEAAGLTEQAIDLWQQASKAALARPAFDEGIAHLLNAIDLLKPSLAKGDVTAAAQCLPLQVQLSVVYMSSRGWAADETKASYEAALELDSKVGKTPIRFSILYGLSVSRYARGEHDEAVRNGQPFVALAEAASDSAPAVVANRSFAAALFLNGDFRRAQPYFDRAIELFDPLLHQNLAHQYGQDLGVGTFGVVTWNLLFLGKTHMARQLLQRCESYGDSCDDVLSLCYLHLVSGLFAIYTQEPEKMALHVNKTTELANKFGVKLFQQYSGMASGFIMLDNGDSAGLEVFEKHEQDFMTTRSRLLIPNYRLNAAYRTIALGMKKEALALASRAKQVIDETKEDCNLTDYYRVLAQIAMYDNDVVQAEYNLRHAIDTARHQGAKLLELRTAIDLAELWQQHNKADSVPTLLSDARTGVDDGDCIEEIARIEQLISAS